MYSAQVVSNDTLRVMAPATEPASRDATLVAGRLATQLDVVPEHFNHLRDVECHRRTSARILISVLCRSAKFRVAPDDVRDGIVVGCERGILNRSIQLMRDKNRVPSWMLPEFINTYKMERHMLCTTLKHIDQSTHLESVVMTPTIPWGELASIPVYRLIPDMFKAKTEHIRRRGAVQLEYTFLIGRTCKNCGSNKIKEQSLQTRSADESSVQFLLCFGCKQRIHACG